MMTEGSRASTSSYERPFAADNANCGSFRPQVSTTDHPEWKAMAPTSSAATTRRDVFCSASQRPMGSCARVTPTP